MEKKKIYVVIRIDKRIEFKAVVTDIHIYSNQSSNKQRIMEYAKKVKKSNPGCQIAVTTREKAQELRKKGYAFNKERKIQAFAELERKSKDILLRQTVYNAFRR